MSSTASRSSDDANTMVIPGYISQFTVTFDTPGTYRVAWTGPAASPIT